MTKLFLVFWIALLPVALGSERLTSAEEGLKKATDDCMSRVSNGKLEDAFGYLFKAYWNDRESYRQAAASLQRQYVEVTGRAEDRLGYPIPGGYEFLGVKRLGASVTRLIYLQKNDRFFIPWAFSFYKAAGEWRLTHISFPDVGSDDIRDFIVIVPAAP